MHRVLLVELAVVERYHRAVQFPYLAGFLDELGAAWTWLRFAVRAERSQGQNGMGLPLEDVESLRAWATNFSPSRVVFNRVPDGSLIDAVARSASEDVVHVLGDTTATNVVPSRVRRLDSGRDAWRALIGVEGTDVSAAPLVPHFGYRPANAAANSLQPLPFLVFGVECTYDRPLSLQPAYRGIDLSGCVRQGGCAFCNRPEHDSTGPRFTLEDARRQLGSLRKTLPAFDGRLAVRLLGEPAIGHVEELAELVREMEFPAADWLLDARADRLVTRQRALAHACEALAGTGHRVHVALVGVESFVRAELERFNKGIDPLQNLDAAIALLRLERDYGDSFGFRAFGGLSTIFFTPWTNLEDLAFNLRIVQQCGLDDVAGKVLGDRLRLEPGLPVTALARDDGLLVDPYEDPALDTASRDFYGTEVPWRFRDPRVETLSRLLVRLHSAASGAPIDDRLGRRVATVWKGVARDHFTPVDVALRFIDRLADGESEGIPEPDGLLDAFVDARSRAVDQGHATSRKASIGCYAWAAHLVELSRTGLKPVSKVEPLDESEVEAFLRALNPPNPRVRTFENTQGVRTSHVFFGESPDKVEAALRWTAQGEDDPDDGRRNVAVAEAGKALGYPPCCAEAFAFRETPRSRLSYGWLHLDRRMACPEEVDCIVHPWATGLFEGYVPCSLACEATLALLRAAEEVVGRIRGADHVESMRARAKNPWLVVLEGQGSALELIPESEPGERFRYRAGQQVGVSAELARALGANEVVMEDERLVLLRASGMVEDLSARAFVWWYRRALQRDFWSRVLTLRGFLGGDHHGAGRSGLDVDDGLRVGRRLVALRGLLSKALSEMRSAGGLGRIRIEQLRPISTAMLSLVLEVDGRKLELYVREATQATPGATRVGPFAILRPMHQNLDDPVLKAAVRVLTVQLNAWVTARQRAKR